jgi:hypothetical protein
VVRRRLLRSALFSRPSGDRRNAPATNTSDLGMDMIAKQGMPFRNNVLLLYSPNLAEGWCSRKSSQREDAHNTRPYHALADAPSIRLNLLSTDVVP